METKTRKTRKIRVANKNISDKKRFDSDKNFVLCQAFGNRCTICGSYFGEDEDVCGQGHMIGVKYSWK
ncbi:MAG: hypothetical protein WC545_02820 [Patescibacteria group bacterium]